MNGDLTKVRGVECLSRVAQRLLQHIEHASRNLPGSQESRRLMRFDTQALRILYGVPIFVSCSADESHKLLTIRFARTRQHDTLFKSDRFKHFRAYYVHDVPDTKANSDSIIMTASVDHMRKALPPYDV